MAVSPTDLTQRPPRSARVRLGGYCILPRMLDKGRATVEGKQGEFKYACPLDQEFLQFAGINAQRLYELLTANKGDTEILEWIMSSRTNQHHPHEIESWSCYQDRRAPGQVEKREYLNSIHAAMAPKRMDIVTWFDLLDVDDFVTFGGKA